MIAAAVASDAKKRETYAAVVAANTVNGGFNGHAILDQLEQNTVYSYATRFSLPD